MAYRKRSSNRKRRSSAPRRRRRVSGIKKNDALIMIGAAAAGYYLGPKINDAIAAKVGTTVDPKIIALAEVAAGYFLPKMLGARGSMAMISKVAGGLLIGSGAHLGLKEFGVVSGYGSVPMINGRMNGYRDVRTLSGLDLPATAPGLSTMQVVSGVMSGRDGGRR